MHFFQSTTDQRPSQTLLSQVVLLLFLAMLGSFLAGLLVQGLGQLKGFDYIETVQSLQQDSPARAKNFIKTALSISHVFTFILPSLIFIGLTYGKNWTQPMRLNSKPKWLNSLLGSLLIIAAFPLVQYIYAINRDFPLPQWAIEQEHLINTTIKNLLYVQSGSELWLNLFTIAVLPAIGEELLFRGILQQKLEDGIKNSHLAIWITALIFSFIHFQFQGFLPRIFLGAILGYLFVWTRNLWIPIIAHLVYNAGQVLLQYAHQRGALGFDLDEVDVVPLGWVLGSVLSIVVLSYFLSTDKR